MAVLRWKQSHSAVLGTTLDCSQVAMAISSSACGSHHCIMLDNGTSRISSKCMTNSDNNVSSLLRRCLIDASYMTEATHVSDGASARLARPTSGSGSGSTTYGGVFQCTKYKLCELEAWREDDRVVADANKVVLGVGQARGVERVLLQHVVDRNKDGRRFLR